MLANRVFERRQGARPFFKYLTDYVPDLSRKIRELTENHFIFPDGLVIKKVFFPVNIDAQTRGRTLAGPVDQLERLVTICIRENPLAEQFLIPGPLAWPHIGSRGADA